jgi:phospholipase D1/2
MTILNPGSNCRGVYEARETGLLVDACDYYRAFYRSALKARHYILPAGWQFDSEVRLLRGEEAKFEQIDDLIPFLDRLAAPRGSGS